MPGTIRSNRSWVGIGAVLLSVVLFSLSLSVIKWPGVPGSVLAFWRLIGSSILWWAVLAGRRHRIGTAIPSRQMWRLALLPAVLFGLNISLAFTAYTRTSIAHADFIYSLAPLVMIPAGFLLFGERPRWRALGWGAMSIVGLAIVLFRGPTNGVATWQGDVLAGVSMMALGGYLLSAKRVRARGVGTLDLMALVMPMALLTASPVVLVLAGDELWPLPAKAWAAIAILSVMTGMVAHGLLAFAHPRVAIGTMSTLQVCQPALSVSWAWLLLDEEITAAQVPGMLLVIGGIALVVWFTQRQPNEPLQTPLG